MTTTWKQIHAAVRAAFTTEVQPEDLARPELHEGAAGCVATRAANALAGWNPDETRSDESELLRHRAMFRRVEAVCTQLEERKQDPASQMWAAELRAAITGKRWLYRCPVHGDRKTLATRHERGVTCGKPLVKWEPRPGGSCCSETAVLVGEVP